MQRSAESQKRSFLKNIAAGNVKHVREYINKYGSDEQSVNVAVRDAEAPIEIVWTKIQRAARQGGDVEPYFKILDLLLSAPVFSPNFQIHEKVPILYQCIACMPGSSVNVLKAHKRFFKVLLKDKRTDRNVACDDFASPLFAILSNRYIWHRNSGSWLKEIFDDFVADPAVNINMPSRTETDEAKTPFMLLVGNHEWEQQLLKRDDLDINAESTKHVTAFALALDRAINNDDKWLAEELAKNPKLKNVNKPLPGGCTPLTLAIGRLELSSIADTLLARSDIDVNESDRFEDTPLTTAIAYKPDYVGKLLARNDINVLKPSEQNITPLMAAAATGNLQALDLLLARKEMDADAVNAKSTETLNTALHIAIGAGKNDIALHLIATGLCELDEDNLQGCTPLLLAVDKQANDVVKALLKKNARHDIHDNIGNSPLMLAVQKGNLELARLLLEAGADVNHCNDKGENAMDQAVQIGDFDRCSQMVKLLLEFKAEIDHVNSVNGIRTSELAVHKNNEWMALHLLRLQGEDLELIAPHLKRHSMFRREGVKPGEVMSMPECRK